MTRMARRGDGSARRNAHVAEVIVDFRSIADRRLAAEARYGAWLAYVEQSRLLGEAGLSTPGVGEQFSAIGKRIGPAMIRLCGWLRSRSVRKVITP
jgi:hypothetical protein